MTRSPLFWAVYAAAWQTKRNLRTFPPGLAGWWARTWARAATLELTVYPFTLRAQRRHERRAAEHVARARRRLELVPTSSPIEMTITIERAR